MKRFNYHMIALAALPGCIGAVMAASSVTAESVPEKLAPVTYERSVRTPARVITIDGFLYEDFESVPDGETGLPEGWVSTSTPGLDADCWSAGTLGRGDTPLNGVSGFKYAFILGNKENGEPHDSWLFSPGVSLTAGREYTIEFYALMPPVSGSDVMEKLEVYIGDGQTAAAMSKELEVIENDNDYWRYYGYTFTPEASGTYHMGFHSVSPAGSNSTLIDDLKITNGLIPVYSGYAEMDMGSTDTRAGILKALYNFGNRGQGPLEVSLLECSPELSVDGLPKTLDEQQDETVTVTLTYATEGDYSGFIKLATNDPTLPVVNIDVTASVKKAVVTGYRFEDFERGAPEGWNLCFGSASVSAYGGHDSSCAWYCSTFYQDDDRNVALGGIGFTTHYVEMGDDPTFSFWYQLTNESKFGMGNTDPTDQDTAAVKVLVSDDCGMTWEEVYTIEPGGEHPHNPSAEYQQVAVPLPQYAGKTCLVRVLFKQVSGSTLFNSFRVLVDDVAIGTQTPVDLKAASLTGPAVLTKGETYTFLASIDNGGSEPVSGYKVRLVNTADNSVLAVADGTEIEPGGRAEIPFSWTPDAEGAVHFVAEVIAETDNLPDNNISYPLHTVVLPANNSVVEIGTSGDRLSGQFYPVCFYAVESKSQSVFYANEMGIDKGVINSMIFRSNLESDFFSEPVSFYIAETCRTDFEDGQFVDEMEFTKVFEGPVYFKEGMKDFVVPFDTPYEYKGGNIVVMGKKNGKEFIYGKYFMIRKSSDLTTIRSINASSFSQGTLDDTEPTSAAVYPEVRFNIVKADAGRVSGRVTDGGTAVAGALVKIAGTELSTLTDTDGRFSFAEAAAGNVAVSVSKHGYYDITSEPQDLVKDGETEFNVAVTALPRHELSGTVVSRATGEPVEGVKISVRGYDDFQTYTDSEGKYHVAGICGDTGAEYTIRLTDDYYMSVNRAMAVESDLTIDFELKDKPLRVHNVSAMPIDGEVMLTWDDPMPEFSHDSGVPADFIGWPHGQSNVIVASVFHNHAKIREISWYTTDGYGYHDNFNVYIFGLDDEGNPDVKNILYVARNVDFADNQWTTHVIGNPVEADGFMIALSCDGFLGIGITDPTDEYPFEDGQHFYAGDNYEWGIFPMSNFRQSHIMLRAYGENMGESSRVQARFPQARIVRPTSDYKIYRFADGEKEDKWQEIASVTENSYRDRDFGALPEGDYRYAVKAVYSGSEAAPIVSKTVHASEIESLVADGLISLSPNPFTGVIYISNPELVREVNIFNAAGARCCSYSDVDNSIDTSALTPGLYVVSVTLADGKTINRRMIRK